MTTIDNALNHLLLNGLDKNYCLGIPGQIEHFCSLWQFVSLGAAVAVNDLLYVRVVDPGCQVRKLVIGKEHSVAEATEGMVLVRRCEGAAIIA